MGEKRINKMDTKKVENKTVTPDPTLPTGPTIKKRELKNTLAAFTPFVKWHTGLSVIGVIERKFTNSGEFGEKSNMELRLTEPCEYTDSEGEVVTVQAGDTLNIGQTAGLNNALTLPLGVLVCIQCIGKKELGRGRKPAWEYKVTYE